MAKARSLKATAADLVGFRAAESDDVLTMLAPFPMLSDAGPITSVSEPARRRAWAEAQARAAMASTMTPTSLQGVTALLLLINSELAPFAAEELEDEAAGLLETIKAVLPPLHAALRGLGAMMPEQHSRLAGLAAYCLKDAEAEHCGLRQAP